MQKEMQNMDYFLFNVLSCFDSANSCKISRMYLAESNNDGFRSRINHVGRHVGAQNI